ncbi:tetratricopeptide repeat protein [Desulfovibrio sp. UCD-KL4C]|uniref:tetratricopeptide repeat protein n=1 Tax=Desulfovibrio sp. UCD-KL4C TaxID=2578120 RepID=UPI0025BEFBD1|nr:tetratricopeptide repeat protein [Desulfovibrio sp. UCD-KL4C]
MSTGQHDKITGVFSTLIRSKVGIGTTTKRILQKTYLFVSELEADVFEVQPLNSHDVPSGLKKKISRAEFLNNFDPEPEHYADVVLPQINALEATIKRGEKHRDRSENYSAEHEFSSAVEIDKYSIKANFGLGLVYLDRGETERASALFERLINLEAIYEAEHKHLFNEFGMGLRKNGMFDQALEYYHKAESLSKKDENLCLNIARAYFEKSDVEGCLKYLNKSLKINPNHEEACLFLEYMRSAGYGKDTAAQPEEAVLPKTKKSKSKKSIVKDFKINF